MNPSPAAVPILMYHEVADPHQHADLARVTQRNYVLETAHFSSHLAALAEIGASTVSLEQLRAWQSDHVPLPERPVVLTFDDGFAGNYENAAALLVKHGFNATFFVITGRIGAPFMMSWSQLSELRNAGMAVESHTVSHPLFSSIDRARTARELGESKREIENRLGSAVRHLSLPHGDTNEHYPELAREAGYESGCSSLVGINERSTDPFMLRRIAMTTATTADGLQRIVRQDPKLLRSIRRRATVKRALARVLGKRTYGRLVNLVYGVQGDDGANPS